MIHGVAKTRHDFITRFHISDADVSVAFQFRSERHFQFLRAFELFVRFRRRERIFNGKSGGAQILHELERGRAKIFVLDQNKNIRVNVKFRQLAARFEQFEQHDVAHAESERGQVHFAAADEFDEIIVTSATSDGAKFALNIKCFKYDARVIGKAANDFVIYFYKITKAARGEILQNGFQFGSWFAGLNKLIHFSQRRSKRRQFFFRFFRRRAFQFINDLEKIVFGIFILGSTRASRRSFGQRGADRCARGGRAPHFIFVKFRPRIPAAQADDKILFGQTKCAQRVNQQRNQFRVRRRVRFTDQIRVELEMLAQAAFLLALVAEQLRNREPLDRLFVITFVRGDHARKRRRHFWSQRNLPFAFVHEVVKLANNFIATFGGEEFERFERWAVVFAETVAARDGSPFFKDELSRVGTPRVGMRKRFGIKIAESGQSFHAFRLKNARRKEKN